jgi:adenine-specific DNA methylase
MGGYRSIDTNPLLIEEWLPVQELGIEARRENSTGQHPPPNRLHVWWARRPLVVSRAAVLASLLPAWRPDWPEPLRERFPTREAYHAWVRWLLGIHGDPIAARQRIAEADAQGKRLGADAYGYRRAFTFSPDQAALIELREIFFDYWRAHSITVLDPTAGGGSIPLEALRLGLSVYANELNPVAALILAATLDYPARFGDSLAEDIRYWGDRLLARLRAQLQQYFPVPEDGIPDGYLWARTVACPQTGKPIPLSPNWWLQRDDRAKVAVRLLVHPDWPECRFEIVRGPEAERVAEQGTIRRGVAVSPWTGEVVDGDYIKRQAQAGRMGQQLYAVVVKTPKGVDFRVPTEADRAATAAAEQELARRLPGWLARDLVPDEEIPEVSNYSRGHRLYGMTRWRDLFAPRQLLAFDLRHFGVDLGLAKKIHQRRRFTGRHEDVHKRIALHELRARLDPHHTTHQRNDAIGVRLLPGLEAAQLADGLVFSALAYDAGVEHDDVGLFEPVGRPIAELFQLGGDVIRVGHIHLAADRPDVIFAGCSGGAVGGEFIRDGLMRVARRARDAIRSIAHGLLL